MDGNPNVGARTTDTSASEGRLIVGVSRRTAKKNKLKSILKKYKDGKGGPGNMLPSGTTSITDLIPSAAQQAPTLTQMTPGRGVTVTPGTYTPQQQSQMASMGMTPMGMGSPQPVSGPGRTAAPPAFARMTNKPHSSLVNIRPPRMKKMKKLKIQSLRSAVKAVGKSPKLVL